LIKFISNLWTFCYSLFDESAKSEVRTITLGGRLKECRKKMKMTQLDIANKLGINHTTISKWESDTYEPDADSLGKLAELYGVTVDFLLGLSSFNRSSGNFAYYGGGDDWTEEEKAAAQAEVLKAQAQRNKAKLLESLGKDVLDKLAQLPEADREMALQQLRQTVEFLNRKNNIRGE
jgi:transcriptional regulator with XRE-family HTH domain